MASYKKGEDGCAGKADLYWFAPESLIVVTDKADPLYDPRVELPVSEALVRSIMRRGILQAVRITPGEPRVVAGRQRVRAALEANRRGAAPPVRVPCVVLTGAGDHLAGAAVAENEIRQDDNPAVKAEKAQRLQALGYSVEDIADDFGVSTATVKGWLKLAAEPVAVRQAVKERKTSVRKVAASRKPNGEQKPLGKRAVLALVSDEQERKRVVAASEQDAQMSRSALAWEWYCAGLRKGAGIFQVEIRSQARRATNDEQD